MSYFMAYSYAIGFFICILPLNQQFLDSYFCIIHFKVLQMDS